MSHSKNDEVEIWGGIECSINRVFDSYFDQLAFSRHYEREEDLKLIANLGIKKLRYPVLWEKYKPTADAVIDFHPAQVRLNTIRELGIEPIVGLVHHGSGPTYASIETDQFSPGLAEYAKKVAEAFPWVNYYTPVNEPLTTARFCGLYGIWYPHIKDSASFIRILMNECKATIMAMSAIREVNPKAKLVQTEDLGKTYSTKTLQAQADFENKRRWLTFDLLMGNVKPGHGLWDYLIYTGIRPEELSYFAENPCTPDLIGFNYYLTSERYLDERVENFEACSIGGNGMHVYADVEAVRVKLNEETGIRLLLKEAWDRFRLPMAITEVQLGCTRDEQLRWYNDILQETNSLKANGVDIRAITAWAMLGSYGWSNLLINPPGRYETGVFDISGGKLRPTALAKFIKSYTSGKHFGHPVMEGKGWWKRDIRVLYFTEALTRRITAETKSSQPLLIIGKNGTLGAAFGRICEVRGIDYQLLSRSEMDLTDVSQIEKVILRKRPWAIVNAAGFVRVDDAETERENCFLANTTGPVNLARMCKKYGVKLLTFSSDLVFNGEKKNSYLESDVVGPLNIYGESKAKAEKFVKECDPSALIIRTSAFFGPWDRYNFVHGVLASLRDLKTFSAAHDIYVSPTYVPDLVNNSLDLLLDDEHGVWHLANSGEISWAQLATEVARRGGGTQDLIKPVSMEDLGYIAKRPAYSVLDSERGFLLPPLEDALDRYFREQQLITFEC